MATELPDYEVGGNKFYFPLKGREITAEVSHSAPDKYKDTMAGLRPDDMDFTVGEVTDGNTGEVIKCTKEIRSLIATMIHDHMTKAHAEDTQTRENIS